MSEQAAGLAERLTAFNNEVIALVEQCSDDDWQATCSEEWPLGVVAHHIGASHFSAVKDLTQMIVAGKPLPEFTPEGLAQMANEHAHTHAKCTQAEVLAVLRENGTALREYTAGLSDDDFQRTTHVDLLGGKITAGQFIEVLILQSAGDHFASMKAALDKK